MKKPVLAKENAVLLEDRRFMRLFDLQYEPGRHYFEATRRSPEELMATKSEEECKAALPDAVSCFVILDIPGEEPRLLLSYEFRYPVGQFLISPPAGLMDPEDRFEKEPVLACAAREIREETGLTVKEGDRLFVVNPLCFSTPGMTDESNALACAVIHLPDYSSLTQEGALGQEMFNGFEPVTKEEARKLLSEGRDRNGMFYSLFTWAACMYFLSDLWK